MGAGYSKRPLYKKLGYKAGMVAAWVQTPDEYEPLLAPLPEGITIDQALTQSYDLIHFFTKERAELEQQFPHLKAAVKPNGMIWISWPKKASKVPTDLTEDVIREIGLEIGLVDVKVCAVDQVWSALKFVYRLKDRT